MKNDPEARSQRSEARGRHSAFFILHSSFLHAFTLIELMIVIVVITVLAGIALPVSKYVTKRAREASQKIMLEKIKSALEDYRAAYGEYPITPSESGGGASGQWRPDNYDYVLQHYPANYDTRCSNSPFTNVCLATNTVETMETDTATRRVDYCLTYPLMLKRLDAGAQPFMRFDEITVFHLVYNPDEVVGVDVFEIKKKHRTKLGVVESIFMQQIGSKAVNRATAIDPVSQKQWKYICTDGVKYIITNHTESGY